MIHIAKATLKEATKKKVLILIGIITLLYLALLILVMYFVGKENGRSMMDDGFAGPMDYLMEISVQVTSIVGFYFSSMLVAFMTILLSTGAVSSEIESGILQGILARPISRSRYYFGKYLGYATIIVVFSTFLYASVLLVSLISGMPFMQMATVTSVIGGWFLFVMEPLTILSLSLWLGVSIKSIAGAILVGGAFVFSMIGNFMGQIGGVTDNNTLVVIGKASILLAPFDALYRRMSVVFFKPTDSTDVLSMIGDATGAAPEPWIGWYAILFIGIMLILGMRSFSKKDL